MLRHKTRTKNYSKVLPVPYLKYRPIKSPATACATEGLSLALVAKAVQREPAGCEIGGEGLDFPNNLGARPFTTAIIATARAAAIRPYSIAVAGLTSLLQLPVAIASNSTAGSFSTNNLWSTPGSDVLTRELVGAQHSPNTCTSATTVPSCV